VFAQELWISYAGNSKPKIPILSLYQIIPLYFKGKNELFRGIFLSYRRELSFISLDIK
jgi:hypothetical protein